MKFEIVATDEIITNNTGLVLVNNIIESTGFKQNINDKTYLKVQSREISNKDIFMTYIGILAQGKTEFERADEYRNNKYFKHALDIEKSPSCSILRQRLNAVGDIERNLKDMKKLIDQTNLEILQNKNVVLTPCYKNYVPLDIDVTPMDNSGSKKEGVSYTYKEFEGFAPIMAYVGIEGYLMRCELREGKANGQCSKTVPFMKDNIDLVKQATRAPILVRTDCGHDCCD
ncbi:MAG: transposase, partial [Bacilli bacterium]|nr:transposase [Bacilli bacterium]